MAKSKKELEVLAQEYMQSKGLAKVFVTEDGNIFSTEKAETGKSYAIKTKQKIYEVEGIELAFKTAKEAIVAIGEAESVEAVEQILDTVGTKWSSVQKAGIAKIEELGVPVIQLELYDTPEKEVALVEETDDIEMLKVFVEQFEFAEGKAAADAKIKELEKPKE